MCLPNCREVVVWTSEMRVARGTTLWFSRDLASYKQHFQFRAIALMSATAGVLVRHP